MSDRQTVVMVTSSYPRFAGDSVGTFMEPIARGVAALGHAVHVVAPWHPKWHRPAAENGIHFDLFRYAPVERLNVFGYAGGLQADVRLRASAIAVMPLAVLSGWRRARQVARDEHASVVHAHWVIPSGVIAAAATGRRPLVISLHGSDVFVAERHEVVKRAARAAFQRAAWITACSSDLEARAIRLGAPADRITVVPYGVDSDRFSPNPATSLATRTRLGISGDARMVLAFGRLVKKKGFEYLIDAAAILAPDHPHLHVVIAGGGDLASELRERARASGVGDKVQFLGDVAQHEIPGLLAAADVAVAPSVHDDAGNVDGLPNVVLEIMASGTPLVSTAVGGIAAVASDGDTARLVPERDAAALAGAIAGLLRQPSQGVEMGRRARDSVCREFSWARTAKAFEAIYDRVTTGTRPAPC
jgi:glycosyltransferase involved in cell wall biosynthesis